MGVGLVGLVGLFAVATVAAPAAAAPAQDPTVTTAPETGLDPEPGGDEPPAVTDDPAADPTAEDDESAGGSTVAEENRRIWLVVAGLVVVALALTLLTVRYWRHTRPAQSVDPEPIPASTWRSRRGRGSRLAVAGADHAAADASWEPRATGEQALVAGPPTRRQSRPTPSQRASAYRAGNRS